MRDLDFTPLFRNAIGFDRMARLLDTMASEPSQNSYPPYNIEQIDENSYQISMAVAGFGDEDLDIEVQDNQMRISGKKAQDESESERNYLYRGIAERAFERRFSLADYIRVDGAKLEHGLLHVKLVREIPEEKKPRSILIETASQKALPN
ncbi:MAG: Hsp20 family protein [Alphaproteobacteria bacterium]|nr:Hsp20 family protein [Alphaproteobacteria bacterium]